MKKILITKLISLCCFPCSPITHTFINLVPYHLVTSSHRNAQVLREPVQTWTASSPDTAARGTRGSLAGPRRQIPSHPAPVPGSTACPWALPSGGEPRNLQSWTQSPARTWCEMQCAWNAQDSRSQTTKMLWLLEEKASFFAFSSKSQKAKMQN